MSYKPRYQWEANSAPSQSWNCGPTCSAAIAGFYNDDEPGIEATRRLVVGPYKPTTYSQQRDMLIKRGVPATLVNITSLAQLRSLVAGGKRPVTLAIYMARVPYSVRGHSFTGWHAVVCHGWGYHNGARGFWINDPNFSPPGGIRPDPARGSRFYSDAVMQSAFINNYQHWAIAPNKPKATDTFIRYEVIVEPATYTIWKVGRGLVLSNPLKHRFYRQSRALARHGIPGYWEVAHGWGEPDHYYINGKSGPFWVQSIWKRSDGTFYSKRVDAAS